jgi:hypothetical protein
MASMSEDDRDAFHKLHPFFSKMRHKLTEKNKQRFMPDGSFFLFFVNSFSRSEKRVCDGDADQNGSISKYNFFRIAGFG